MQAIILAAGMGKRLKELTRNNTKCMVKVNGVTLIDRMLHQIDKHSLSRIVIVVGYEGQKLIDYIGTLDIKTPIVYVENSIYDKTNNIYSLALAKDYLTKEDTLLFESDIIFEDSVLEELLSDPRDTLALVDKYEPWMDGTCVKLAQDDSIAQFVPGKQFDYSETDEYYKTVNIYKFSREFSQSHYVPFLDAYQKALGENEYYEQVLRVITMLDAPAIRGKRLTGQRWYEIDDIQDLDIAESLFAEDDERINLIHSRYGGFWRYPKLLDFCYLVNPYYPPKKLKDELKASFDVLLTEYPSGMKVNSLLAAKNFGVHQENILVGNGAAELIKSLMNHLSGVTGFIRPTFEEYPNRYAVDSSVYFVPDNKDYSYTADDLIDFFDDKSIDNLVVVNPDNPSGNYITKKGILRLVEWAAAKGIKLLIDESFVDFADEEDNSLIDQKILDANSHLFVMKSISKSYGVPGLRLGVLASGDTETVALMKKDVAIWNINSFAEYYMQIEEKYKKDYAAGLVRYRQERKRFVDRLSTVKGLRVIPSQANFVMVELDSKMSPRELLKVMLVKHNILIKELTGKTNGGNYLRFAIRDEKDNDKLVDALIEELS
ncbi:Histidinol-phosphate/aromatic aminotransferase or cobyric acid decarboxylase [Lachnospiraceae bacterium]|nr:Histidinol-phosphate/aromatic aminotransferase or cobyric acid decarboxylase [Lachnospiraceae bacterium]